MHKGVNGVKIQSMGAPNYFIFYQVALLGVSDHCINYENVCPFPMNIYILESNGLDSISCTVFIRVMGYKYLLLVTHNVAALILCRHGVGGRRL